MSWIKDVAHELKELDVSKKSLMKFGMTVGGIFLLLALLFMYKNIFENFRTALLVIGAYLFIGGIIFPERLKSVYKIWMGFAFALGWIVSRFILSILFIFVMTPIGFIAKISGKKFLDVRWEEKKDSYWIPKENKVIDYEKMY